jgi:hypothetical protein
VAKEAVQAHQHAAHGAIAADEILDPAGERALDQVEIHRIQHDHGVVVHPQCLRGVDPVAVPARRAQPGIDLARVIAALARQEDVIFGEGLQVARVPDRTHVPADVRTFAAGLRSREERGLDQIEVALGPHALDQHRAHHATPADYPHPIHCNACEKVMSLFYQVIES